MLKPNELRIGNWLEYPFIGKSQIRNGMDIDNVYEDAGNPIPLTPEILEKLGLEQSTHQKFARHWFSFDLRLSIRVLKKDGRCWVRYAGYPITNLTEKQGSIYYLHQLQNLYFALTGTELTIDMV
jgi:hypothetical protein